MLEIISDFLYGYFQVLLKQKGQIEKNLFNMR